MAAPTWNGSSVLDAYNNLPRQVDPAAMGARLAGGLSSLGTAINASVASAKVPELIKKYNDPNDPDFAGLQGSARTLRLAQLLRPWDPATAARYEERAAEERRKDYGAEGMAYASPKKVAAAPLEKTLPKESQKSPAGIQAEIDAITKELKARAEKGDPDAPRDLAASAPAVAPVAAPVTSAPDYSPEPDSVLAAPNVAAPNVAAPNVAAGVDSAPSVLPSFNGMSKEPKGDPFAPTMSYGLSSPLPPSYIKQPSAYVPNFASPRDLWGSNRLGRMDLYGGPNMAAGVDSEDGIPPYLSVPPQSAQDKLKLTLEDIYGGR